MKRIRYYLKNHIREDMNAGHYTLVSIFLGICLYLNYKLRFYPDFLAQQVGAIKFFSYLLLYSLAYFFTVGSYSIFYKKTEFLKNRNFWMKSLLVLSSLALDSSLPYFRDWTNQTFVNDIQYWVYKVSNNLLSFFTILLPLILYYYFGKEKDTSMYGLQPKHFDKKPYFYMLLLMLPLIVVASFHVSFLNQYPMYRASEVHTYLGLSEWLTTAIYEVAYGFDFVSVEFLFRGFMVIGLMQFLGRGAVFAMATTYCFLHFGKPAGEAISSIFGGYLLGVIAYETKSIWGGVIVHVGIAWMMEAAAYLQKL